MTVHPQMCLNITSQSLDLFKLIGSPYIAFTDDEI